MIISIEMRSLLHTLPRTAMRTTSPAASPWNHWETEDSVIMLNLARNLHFPCGEGKGLHHYILLGGAGGRSTRIVSRILRKLPTSSRCGRSWTRPPSPVSDDFRAPFRVVIRLGLPLG